MPLPIEIGCCCKTASGPGQVAEASTTWKPRFPSSRRPAMRMTMFKLLGQSLRPPLRVVMGMFPSDMRLLGAEANDAANLQRARFAIDLAAEAGAKMLVLGAGAGSIDTSGDASGRSLHFLVRLLGQIAKFASTGGITLLLEPISFEKTNVFNTVAETAEFLTDFELDSIGITLDLLQAQVQGESLEVLRDQSCWIKHVHFPSTDGRHPSEGYSLTELCSVLLEIGYRGAISVESAALTVDDHYVATAQVLREILRDAHIPD